MATGTVHPTAPPPPPVPADSVQRERLIERQLRRTSLQVRVVDLASLIALWIIGVLSLFLLAAVIDHGIGLGVMGRLLLLVLLVAGTLYCFGLQIVPLVLRRINPAYAARTIEEATPSLKNSLINFLLLRQERSGIREIVYQAVERQAAADIAAVPVETTVDRTRLIHAGYGLCVVMALLAAYKILSPKDPFQSVARVLAPWADIARPSRVQILGVQPGSTQVYHGQTVKVTATVRGVREGDTVSLRYTTADGQAVDQVVPMAHSAGDQYECVLPPPDDRSHAVASGLLQDVTYRLVAGDAETFPYRLTVIAAPTIIVDRLEYAFPAYTKKPPVAVLQQGDIKALEGTQVTIHAIANQPIKSAWIEFDPSGKDGPAEIAPLAADGQRARGTITLQLRPDRQTPWHTTYQVRFHNQQADKSLQPIVHRIEVVRDLPPEVQILSPTRLRIEVPENGAQTIEVRGVDPDFGLARLAIEGDVRGKAIQNIDLLVEGAGHPPQITAPYVFRPAQHGLKAGDELRYSAVAEDNRLSWQTGQPEPNVARTRAYTLVVLPPQPTDQGQSGNQQQPGGQQGDEGRQPPDANSAPQPQQTQKPGDKQGDPARQEGANQKSGRPDDANQPPPSDGQKGDAKQNPNQRQDKQAGQEQSRNQPSGEQQSGKDQQAGEPQQTGDQQQAGQSGGSKQAGNQQQTGQQQTGQQQSGQRQGDQQQGSSQQGSSQQGSQQQGGGQQGSSQQGGARSGNAGQQSEQEGKAGSDAQGRLPGQERGGSPDRGEDQGKAHDGRAIEEVVKEMEKRGSRPEAGDRQQQPSQPAGEPGSGDQTMQSGQAGQAQQAGRSDAQGQRTPNTGQPEGNDQQPGPQGKAGEKQAHPGSSKPGDATDRQPDAKRGQSPSEQTSGGNRGGTPQGPDKTDKGEQSPESRGEKHDPGAGQTGDEGAGAASEDKSGSGEGTRANRDRNKEMKPDSDKPEKTEPSPASSSRKQSDSKGASSGEESGGGKRGAGQSAGQEGNDSAGSKSAADQGAGKANETGSGETGSQAGQQQNAAGKTGKSGAEAGDGSAGRPGDQQPGNAPQSPDSGDTPPSKSPDRRDAREPGKGGGSGQLPVGGQADETKRFQNAVPPSVDQDADQANLEYAKKATEMALRYLKEEEHNPDPDLLNRLGWTRDDLAEFLRRWEALEKSAQESPAGQRELDEALRSLGLRDPAHRKRAGGTVSDNQRDLRDAGNRTTPPPKYRELFDAFRKGAARSSP